MLVAAIIDSLASSPVNVFLPFLLLAKGVQPTQLGFVMGAYFIGSLAGKALLGRSVDIIGNKKAFILSEVAMAITLLGLSINQHLAILLFLSLLLGIFTKGTSPVVQTMFSELSDREHYHKIYAVSEFAIGTAAMIATVFMGFLSEKFGISLVFVIGAVLAIAAIFPILASYTLKRSF